MLSSLIKPVFSFTVSILILSSCENKRQDILSIGSDVQRPTQVGKDISMLYFDSTLVKIKLQAKEMISYTEGVKEPYTELPKGVQVFFYDQKEKPSTTLKADYGIRYDQTHKMEVKYNVEVVNVNGEKLNTEHLIWDEQQKKIISDVFVKITTAKEIIMGNGLVSNQDFTQYEIKDITGNIKLDEK